MAQAAYGSKCTESERRRRRESRHDPPPSMLEQTRLAAAARATDEVAPDEQPVKEGSRFGDRAEMQERLPGSRPRRATMMRHPRIGPDALALNEEESEYAGSSAEQVDHGVGDVVNASANRHWLRSRRATTATTSAESRSGGRLRRSRSTSAVVTVKEVAASTDGVFGTENAAAGEKRTFSKRLSETLVDMGREMRRKIGDLVWRRNESRDSGYDSPGAEMQAELLSYLPASSERDSLDECLDTHQRSRQAKASGKEPAVDLTEGQEEVLDKLAAESRRCGEEDDGRLALTRMPAKQDSPEEHTGGRRGTRLLSRVFSRGRRSAGFSRGRRTPTHTRDGTGRIVYTPYPVRGSASGYNSSGESGSESRSQTSHELMFRYNWWPYRKREKQGWIEHNHPKVIPWYAQKIRNAIVEAEHRGEFLPRNIEAHFKSCLGNMASPEEQPRASEGIYGDETAVTSDASSDTSFERGANHALDALFI